MNKKLSLIIMLSFGIYVENVAAKEVDSSPSVDSKEPYVAPASTNPSKSGSIEPADAAKAGAQEVNYASVAPAAPAENINDEKSDTKLPSAPADAVEAKVTAPEAKESVAAGEKEPSSVSYWKLCDRFGERIGIFTEEGKFLRE